MDVSKKIILRVGDTYTLRLPGLGVAGYVWTYKVVGNTDLVDVSTTTERLQLDDGSKHMTVGSSSDELFIIRAIRAGNATIRFSQQRCWERNEPAWKEYLFEFDIS